MNTPISKLMNKPQDDKVIWNEWHPVAWLGDIAEGKVEAPRLLGIDLDLRPASDEPAGWRAARRDTGAACRVLAGYGMLWVCLGEPARGLPAIGEASEADRRHLYAGAFRVHVGGLRAIENFLDMGHFPYVHAGWLGEEPHTEVLPYKVEVDAASNDLYARDCVFYQPQAAAAAQGGIDTSYVYRVPRPYTAILYKTCPPQPERRDVIALLIQPIDEDWCVAHTVMYYLDDASTDEQLRQFQQTIFKQDLQVLTNQAPKRLPMRAGVEQPVRADAMSVGYRRWLKAAGVVYGTTDGPAYRPVQAGWHRVCKVEELDGQTVLQREVEGNEVAVWRATDGTVSVWENRCPHRGVRLSLGTHRGDALQCLYHGWRFGAGQGATTAVPAHPRAASPNISVKAWKAEVRDGAVWAYPPVA